MIKKINNAISNSVNSYHRLILLVDGDRDHKQLAKEISEQMNTEFINVNFELSKCMLTQTAKQRKINLLKSINEILPDNKTILLDDIEILFDVELEYDPLRLLKSLSRNQIVIAFWSGYVSGNKLIYAEQGHPEYRSYDTKDLLVIEINKDKVEI